MLGTIDQLTVFADVEDGELLDCIAASAKTVCPRHACLVTRHALTQAAEDDGSKGADFGTCRRDVAPLLFLRYWEKEAADVTRAVQGAVPLMRQQECLVTTSQDVVDGEVTYAVYKREMPVLCLHESCGGTEDKATQPAAYADALRALLVHHRRAGETAQTAIERFFVKMQSLTGMVVAIECPATPPHDTTTHGVDALCREAVERFYTTRCVAALHGLPNTTALTQSTIVLPRCVVYLGSDGGPLHAWFLPPPASPQTIARRDFDVPKPHARFTDVLTQLRMTTDGTMTAAHNALSATDVQTVLQGNPHLPGALMVLNRYEHRGLLRYLLHTGCLVVYGNHRLTTLVCAVEYVSDKIHRTDEDDLASRIRVLTHFEQHWLEMPLPTNTLYLHPATDEPESCTDSARLFAECARAAPGWREQKIASTMDAIDSAARWLDEVTHGAAAVW